MSWHSIGGHLQIFYGDATASGSAWVPTPPSNPVESMSAPAAGNFWTVMVLEIEHGEIGKTGLGDRNHIPLAGQKIALVGNWQSLGAAPVNLSSDMIVTKVLGADPGVEAQLHNIFAGAQDNILTLLSSLRPSSAVDSLGPAGSTGNSIIGLSSGSDITIGTLGTLKAL